MAEQNKTQMGDGADNYGQAAGQMAKAAKQLGQRGCEASGCKRRRGDSKCCYSSSSGQCARRKSRRRDCRRYGGRWPLGCDSFCGMGYASHTV